MAIIGEITGAVFGVLDRILPDEAAREKAKIEMELALRNVDVQIAQMQADVNKQEAANQSLFVSGWRPFIGWICGISLGYQYIIQPMLAFAIANSGRNVVLPAFDMGELSTILIGMLGLGALRTTEKVALPWLNGKK